MAKSLIEVLVLNALVPVYWFVYTYCVSGYGLDFLNGPYSAKAIALRTTAHGAPPYPGQHDLFTAALYFLKSAKLNVGAGFWGQALFALALAGTVAAVWKFRRYGVFLLLWLPLPFYALSIAYGSVPIYLPVWYPFSYYNVRYGLELLPVFAVFPAVLTGLHPGTLESEGRQDRAVGDRDRVVASQLCIGLSRNTRSRCGRRKRIPAAASLWNERWPTLSRDCRARLRCSCMEPSIPERCSRRGFRGAESFPKASILTGIGRLLDPARHADYIVACQGDPVWAAVQPQRAELTELLSINVPGQARCTIYKRGRL